MKRLLPILLILPLFLLSSCMYDAADQGSASKIVQQWHEAYKNGNWEQVLAPYDKTFFKEQTKDEWLKHLHSFTERFGPLKDIHPVFEQKDPRFRGDYYVYGFTLIFDHGRADETVTVFKALEKDNLVIAGHIIRDKQ